MMETWRQVWRQGIVPNASTEGLEALRTALETDDERLIQGGTTNPPPLLCVHDWKCNGACGMALIGWLSGSLPEVDTADHKVGVTVGSVEEAFADLCWKCDAALGEPAGCRWFLNWFDDTPRDEMRRELLAEVELALRGRQPAPEKIEDIFSVPGHELPAA